MDMYDKASRGPWGSFLFVARQFARRQRSYLASLGAFIAIITLATDPFSQATVSLESCLMPISLQARIPIANRYIEVGPHYAVGSNVLDTPMQYAVYRALLVPPANSSQSVKVDCTTGNCTFPADQGATFTTLSMCHSCRDILNTIRFSNAFGVHVYELPNGLSLQGAAVIEHNCLEMHWWTEMPNVPRKSNCANAPLGFECSLRPCVKTYGANYTNGVYSEEELSRAYLHHVPGPVRQWEVAMNRTVYNGTWRDCQGTELRSEKNTVQVALPGIQQEDIDALSYPSLWYPPECAYTVTGISSNALADFIIQNLGPPEPASKEGMGPGSEQALAAAAEPMNVSLSRVEGRWQLTREGGSVT
ncbi:hypothetical protein EsHS_00006392 [Epichloe bromicola]